MNGRPPEEGDEAAAKQPMMVVNGLLGLQHQAEIYRGSAVEHSSERENIESAARARYNRDLQQARRTLREALRSDLPAAHMGLGVTVIALIVVASVSGPRWTLIIAGVLLTWFLLALAVIHIGSGRGRDAVRRAYIATFGWGNWI